MILSVKLRNFRSHRDTHVEFKHGLNAVVGHNGSGKSSLVQAIGLAMFGVGYKTKTQVSAGQTNGSVEVTFFYDGLTYTTYREIGDNSVYRVFSNGNLLSDGKSPTLDFLKSLYGVNCELDTLYKELVCVGQFQATGLFQIQQALRKEVFDDLFNTKQYRLTYENLIAGEKYAKELIIAKETEIRILETKQEQSDKNLLDKQKLELELANKRQDLHNANVDINDISIALGIMEVNGILGMLANEQTILANTSELAKNNALILAKKNSIKLKKQEADDIGDAAKRVRELTRQTEVFRVELAEWQKAKSEYDTAKGKLTGELELLNKSVGIEMDTCVVCGSPIGPDHKEHITGKIKSISDSINNLKLTYATPANPQRDLQKAYDDLNKLDRLVGEVDTLEAELVGLTSKVKELEEKLGSVDKTTIEKYKQLKKSLEFLKTKKGQLEGSIQSMESHLDSFVITDYTPEIAKLKQEIKTIEETSERIKEVRSVYKKIGPFITKRYVETISGVANKTFSEAMGTKYQAALRLTDDYNLVATIAGNEINFPELSGGQQVVAALSARLAMAQLLSKFNFMLIDEPFDSLDGATTDQVVSALQRHQGQMIAVVHQDYFDTDNIIRLEMTDGKTSVV